MIGQKALNYGHLVRYDRWELYGVGKLLDTQPTREISIDSDSIQQFAINLLPVDFKDLFGCWLIMKCELNMYIHFISLYAREKEKA